MQSIIWKFPVCLSFHSVIAETVGHREVIIVMSYQLSLFLFLLVSFTLCLDYDNLLFDDVSGDLVKPTNWSQAKFDLVKKLRLKVGTF